MIFWGGMISLGVSLVWSWFQAVSKIELEPTRSGKCWQKALLLGCTTCSSPLWSYSSVYILLLVGAFYSISSEHENNEQCFIST